MIIGIDPGQKTGYAVYDPTEDKLVEVTTLSFWSVYQKIVALNLWHDIAVVIEVPNSKHVWHKVASSERALQRQGVNVGGVIREAELLAEGIERLGVPVKRVQPAGKVDADKFKAYTGWSSRTNQHERDAALMCFRRKIRA